MLLKVMIGKIVAVHGGRWDTLWQVEVEQLRTHKHFVLTVGHSMNSHPLDDVMEYENSKHIKFSINGVLQSVPAKGVKVAFVQGVDESGLIDSLMHYDAWMESVKLGESGAEED